MPATAATAPASATRAPHSGVLIAALSFAAMVGAMLQTLVVPVLSTIGARLDADAGAVSWVLTANLLAAAVMTPLFGKTGDLYGKKRMLLVALGMILAGSLLAAVTTSLPLLIVARVLQGAWGGLFPVALGALRDELPPNKLTGAMAMVSGMIGIGGGIGLVLTGLLTNHHGDYHRVFWAAFVLTALAAAAVLFVVPRREPTQKGRIDWAGAGLLGAALVTLLLPVSQGNTWGWTSVRTIGLFVVSAALFAAWATVERRVADPMVDMKVFVKRPVAFTNLAGVLVGVNMFVGFLAVSQFVQMPERVAGYGFTASVLSASTVYLLPGALSAIIAAPVGGLLVRRFGGRHALAVAGAISLVAYVFVAFAHDKSWHLIVVAVAVQSSVAIAYAAMPALIIAEVPVEQTGIANSVNAIARSVGSSLASAIVTSLLTSHLIAGLPVKVPTEGAFTASFVVGAIAGGLVLLVALVGLPRHRTRTIAAHAVPTPAETPADARA
ncbi:MFS transporter [Yinghuangia seranimata]|uniref:MFS transporter n=1 Tax=Yinghuangia seranimata TaxID=408067 RepID=UPI00248D06C5|nr:MFS transporter [Yinghuangia seranimata]MDI2131813.1 MFS transporter [Yinghuangia seranimata]